MHQFQFRSHPENVSTAYRMLMPTTLFTYFLEITSSIRWNVACIWVGVGEKFLALNITLSLGTVTTTCSRSFGINLIFQATQTSQKTYKLYNMYRVRERFAHLIGLNFILKERHLEIIFQSSRVSFDFPRTYFPSTRCFCLYLMHNAHSP